MISRIRTGVDSLAQVARARTARYERRSRNPSGIAHLLGGSAESASPVPPPPPSEAEFPCRLVASRLALRVLGSSDIVTSNDITVEILKEIRDAVRVTNDRVDGLRTELSARIGATEVALLDIAEQQRFVVRHLKTLTLRDSRFEGDITDLRVRVETLEAKVEGKTP